MGAETRQNIMREAQLSQGVRVLILQIRSFALQFSNAFLYTLKTLAKYIYS